MAVPLDDPAVAAAALAVDAAAEDATLGAA